MAGMNGMTMMLKSMGIDPDDIQKNVESFKGEVITMIQKVDGRLANIELQNATILSKQQQIITALEAMYSGKLQGNTGTLKIPELSTSLG